MERVGQCSSERRHQRKNEEPFEEHRQRPPERFPVFVAEAYRVSASREFGGAAAEVEDDQARCRDAEEKKV